MFWILVTALIVIALVIIIVPLLRVADINEISREDQNIVIAKDKLADLKKSLESKGISEEQFSLAKSELENTLAIDLENLKANEFHQGGKWLIAVLFIALPLASIGLYQQLGKPDLLDPKAKLLELQQSNKSFEDMSVPEIVELVKKRLNENPEDGEGWYVLGRTFMKIQKYTEAVTAYQRSYEFLGDEPNIMLALADAMAMTKQGLMTGEPEQLVEKAIEIDPSNQIGLWLGGLAAEQRNDIPKAYGLWSRLLPLLREDPSSYNEIKVMLTQLKETFPELPELAIEDKEVMTASLQVYLKVTISDSIKEKLSGDELVFVYAKAVTGPPMPLAARRLKVSDLPINIVLSDADAMLPQLKLSSVNAFTVGARVSMSGNPIAQKGDYFMEVSPLDKNSVDEVIELSIQTIVE